MTHASRSFADDDYRASAQSDNHTGDTDVSSSKVLDQDIRGFRMRFARYWSQWLRANYSSPYAVHQAFGCTLQTACNWWDADHKPGGEYVALAGRSFSDYLEGARK